MKLSPALPGRCETPKARSVLVVAPHYDDEILGCGGLLAQRLSAGAAVRVLFLSDGGGGEEAKGAPAGYAARRREEADRVAELFAWSGSEHLALPDGELGQHLPEISAALERALLAQRPELLLLPSPLEVSADHRAAFGAAQRLLAPLRSGELLSAIGDMEVLLYEVNRPLDPDLLVDVSAEGELIAKAMTLYESQEERHPYAAAGLGLRRFRTLSLGPEVALAEGFRRLSVSDFTARSARRLLADLGAPLPDALDGEDGDGPLVSVIVRTKDRPRLLPEALESIARQIYRRLEVIIVNDGGERPSLPAGFPFPVRTVDLDPGRGRAAAANAGIAAARGDLVGFLDDDDLFYPEHLATLVHALQEDSGSGVYSDAAVVVYERQGKEGGEWFEVERRLSYSRDFDPDLLLLDNYIPLNSLLVPRAKLRAAGDWDESLPIFEDWDFLIALTAVCALRHVRATTCEYRLFRGSSHHALGERGGRRDDFLEVKARVLSKHRQRLDETRLARAVARLRDEAVEAVGESERLRAKGRALAAELQALRADITSQTESLSAAHCDIERQNRLLGEKESVIADQATHLERTYAEIDRLNGVIRQMERTRAWRLHLWWKRRRGSGD